MAAPRNVVIANINDPKGDFDPKFFRNMYKDLLQQLRSDKSLVIHETESVTGYKDLLANLKPEAVLYVNTVVAKYGNVNATLMPYIENGGLAILGTLFPNTTTPPETNRFFRKMGLPWESGEYCRTMHQLTPVGKALLQGLGAPDGTFSTKSLHLATVAPDHRLVTCAPGALTMSHVFPQVPADPNLAMAAFARMGNGALFYVGDVNAEEGSNQLIHALCKLTL